MLDSGYGLGVGRMGWGGYWALSCALKKAEEDPLLSFRVGPTLLIQVFTGSACHILSKGRVLGPEKLPW